ncbi:MAG: SDR family oxidoreductase [Microthrixaceae bacterium]|nr:SDR family oxidoreductase [Microthrixaceae bacterium]
MDLQLKARVILVVGGHGLVGSAVVKRLRAEGAIAIPASRSANEGIVMDATSDESVNAGVARVLAEHGRIDGLVMTAATVPTITDPKLNSEPSRVLDGIDTKAMTFIRITNAVLPHMTAAGYGRVVGVSGQNAAYTANMTGSLRNAALIIASKHFADQVAGTGVTVNAISPGVITHDPVDEVHFASSGQSSPDEIADLIAFLISPLSRPISGETIAVGHRTLGMV